MNVAVINGRDLLKYSLIVVIGMIISVFIFKNIKGKESSSTIQKETEKKMDILENLDCKRLIRIVLPMFELEVEEDSFSKEIFSHYGKTIFTSQLAMLNYLTEKGNTDESDSQDQEETQTIELAETGLHTNVIEENNIAESYTNEVANVRVKNQTNFDISAELANPDYQFTNKKDILIFHTHTCESYTPTENYNYQMTGSYRTTDLNFSVAKVGEELMAQLTEYGFNVTHDTTYHDYPAYSGSYGRSLQTVENILKDTTSAEMVIDLHRDAVGSNNNYAPTVQIGEEQAAQLMLVMGSDGGGLQHPKWRQNFKMAVKIQQRANELYPGLFRPIILRNSRYNQHVTTGACIIEVGATGNTMEQCLTSMKYLSKVLNEVMSQ